jgi:hypothetical protein
MLLNTITQETWLFQFRCEREELEWKARDLEHTAKDLQEQQREWFDLQSLFAIVGGSGSTRLLKSSPEQSKLHTVSTPDHTAEQMADQLALLSPSRGPVETTLTALTANVLSPMTPSTATGTTVSIPNSTVAVAPSVSTTTRNNAAAAAAKGVLAPATITPSPGVAVVSPPAPVTPHYYPTVAALLTLASKIVTPGSPLPPSSALLVEPRPVPTTPLDMAVETAAIVPAFPSPHSALHGDQTHFIGKSFGSANDGERTGALPATTPATVVSSANTAFRYTNNLFENVFEMEIGKFILMNLIWSF